MYGLSTDKCTAQTSLWASKGLESKWWTSACGLRQLWFWEPPHLPPDAVYSRNAQPWEIWGAPLNIFDFTIIWWQQNNYSTFIPSRCFAMHWALTTAPTFEWKLWRKPIISQTFRRSVLVFLWFLTHIINSCLLKGNTVRVQKCCNNHLSLIDSLQWEGSWSYSPGWGPHSGQHEWIHQGS